MASGHTRKPLSFTSPDIPYRGFGKGRRKVDERTPNSTVKVICSNGQMLPEPKLITIRSKDQHAAYLRFNCPSSESMVLPFMEAMGFEHSVVLYGFIADFYHHGLRLCVEIDGPMHQLRKEYDKRRDEILRRNGISTERIPAWKVYENPEASVRHLRGLIPRPMAEP